MTYTCIDKGVIRSGNMVNNPVVTDMNACKRLCDANEKCTQIGFSNDQVIDGRYPCTMFSYEGINESTKIPIGYDPKIWERFCVKGKVASHPSIVKDESSRFRDENSPITPARIVACKCSPGNNIHNMWFWIAVFCLLIIFSMFIYITKRTM